MILRFLKGVATSRLGHLLAALHLVLVVYEFAQKSAAPSDMPCAVEPSSAVLAAGRLYHYHYESDLLQVLTFLDLPALFLGELALALLSPLRFCAYTASWIGAIFVLAFASFQWLLVGHILEAIVRASRRQVPS